METRTQMGVVVGLPCSRAVMPEWAVALATQSWPTNINVCYVPIRNVERAKAREMIVEGAMRVGAPYIWMVDDDVEVPSIACRQLMKTIKEAPDDVMAVGGIYPSKQQPCEPIVYVGPNGHGAFWKWKKDTIFECNLIGTGCLLIKTEVFDKLPRPWFKDIDEDHVKMTDDGWFCDLLHQGGFKILADAHVLCTHWDNAHQIPYKLSLDCYPMLPKGKERILQNLPDGWMTGEELSWLTDEAANHQLIVELGSFLGRSTVAMARSTQGNIWAIDDFKGVRDSIIRHDCLDKVKEYQKNLLERFVQNTSDLPNVYYIQADHADYSKLPEEWLRGSKEEKPDMVFIDGSHEYEDVKRDIIAWKERLRPGGLLCGHDRDWPGVDKALKEVLPHYKQGPGTLWSAA